MLKPYYKNKIENNIKFTTYKKHHYNLQTK